MSGQTQDENAPLPHQNIFMQEDEMTSWLQGHFYSASTHPQTSVSLALPPPPSQIMNLLTGVTAVVRETTQVGSSVATDSHPIVVPGLSQKAREVAIDTACEIAPTSSWGVCTAETEPIQIPPRKQREKTIEETEEARGSTSRKRSRAAEMHNISERKRREKINEKMKALQELIPRCNKTDKASMLDDAVEYVKSLQMQIQMMMSMGGSMMPMMYPPNMQHFMPHKERGMMDMNRPPFMPPFPSTPFPRQAHMGGLGSSYSTLHYPFPTLPSQQPYPVSNQPQFPGYMNPYSQFAGIHQTQQPPPLQNRTTSQLSFSQATSSKEFDKFSTSQLSFSKATSSKEQHLS